MMSVRFRRVTGMVALLLLTGCKVDLHSGLQEGEANQMLALLMLAGIDADKRPAATGTVNLRVERAQFVHAVEVLRQHGLPQRRRDSVADVFPSGQLVSSPLQEQAKLIYLKEQRIEKMLTGMEGVISADVSIAHAPPDSAGRPAAPPGVAVLVKYTPEVNLAQRVTDIKSLVHDSVPGLAPERISVVLQASDYRLPAAKAMPSAEKLQAVPWPAAIVALALLVGAGGFAWFLRRRRRTGGPA
ncbi:protein EsaJ [Pandoraea terrae]|uniref:Lipoprotein n=1 Tax=Pandoraea terrae TaxID=1537710 RepID=A0A5E4ZFX1_9BURK|nr:type III secretion inner membrane ring lipoprotein SctJ [Pandoraea terrae]VVE59200.1 protein EsaJ [Pandoraea terrae]